MMDKIIAIEDRNGPFQPLFQRIMRMVPDKDKKDKKSFLTFIGCGEI